MVLEGHSWRLHRGRAHVALLREPRNHGGVRRPIRHRRHRRREHAQRGCRGHCALSTARSQGKRTQGYKLNRCVNKYHLL